MTKMTPREALYYICLELGPLARTERDDNITQREAKLRDAIRTLQNFIDYRHTGDSMEGLQLEDFHHHTHEQQLTLDLEENK